jgi:hypothetical protein
MHRVVPGTHKILRSLAQAKDPKLARTRRAPSGTSGVRSWRAATRAQPCTEPSAIGERSSPPPVRALTYGRAHVSKLAGISEHEEE